MVLDLKGFFNGGNREFKIETELDFSGEEYGGEHIFPKPVAVIGKISNKADVTHIDLVCKVPIVKSCDRCGKMTAKDLTVNINRVAVNHLEREEDDEILLIPDEKLDLYEFCFGEILLSVPMKHLCSEDCKGICLNCGKNLNEGSCGCVTKSIDPRLEVLATLLEQDQED